MSTIILPSHVYDYNLYDLLATLGKQNTEQDIIIDFAQAGNYSPGALVGLIAQIRSWVLLKKNVKLRNLKICGAYKYLQRIDFLKNCGLNLDEEFTRHNSTGRFVPIKPLTGEIEPIATDIATCIAPELADSFDPEESGFYDYIEYSVSELGNNVFQHSQGKGFVASQYYQSNDLTRIAIADTGIGIKNSFQATGSPHWREGMDDIEAIKKALEPEVSSRTHLGGLLGSENAGVGLTLLCELAVRTSGTYTIASGSGFVTPKFTGIFKEGNGFNGTLCSIVFKRKAVKNFTTLLYQAKLDFGLIRNNPLQFNGLFT